MVDHDGLYNRLFDHPNMVGELLCEFLAGPCVDAGPNPCKNAGGDNLGAKLAVASSRRRTHTNVVKPLPPQAVANGQA